MARSPVAGIVLLAVAFIALAAADCPDKDIRCRIPKIESLVKEKSRGCEGAVNAGIGGKNPTGSVSVGGKCFITYKDTDGTIFAPVGGFRAGTCYNWGKAKCLPCHSLVEQCGAKVPGCRLCEQVCTKPYTAKVGDNCWAIANRHGMTLDALRALNPGVNCTPLQPNQQFCLGRGDGPCRNVCEGTVV